MSTIQTLAVSTLFAIIFFQFPLFRTKCRTGVCESPLHIIMSQVSQSFTAPPDMLRCIVFPGALVQNWLNPETAPKPNWETILDYYKLNGTYEQTPELSYRVDVMVGSYFVVASAFQNFWQSGKMGILGFFLVGWGIYKETAFTDAVTNLSVKPFLMPWFFIALLLSVLSSRIDISKYFPSKSKQQRVNAAAAKKKNK